MDIKTEKNTLRRDALARRDTMSEEERKRKSQAIARRLLGLSVLQDRSCIHTFASFRSEVNTYGLLDSLWMEGKRVVMPVIDAKNRIMFNKDVAGMEELSSGYMGIPEPSLDLPEVPPEDIEIILTPGAAFDAHGGRIGYGGGYYDRLMASSDAVRIALAFDAQLVGKVPRESHDLAVHAIVTESTVIRCGEWS